jgi:hypothetical protein
MIKPAKGYETPKAFRQALESRINARSSSHAELQRFRRLVAFDRLLARLFKDQNSPWIVKGGYGLEVRYGLKARTTKDVDLALPVIGFRSDNPTTTIQKIWEDLQEATAQDIGDHFVINVAAPRQEFDAPPGGGARLPVDVFLDRRIFAKFHLDVGIGDVILDEVEWTTGEDYLSFAGIPASTFRIIPLAQQFAEKVHSYTLPRKGGVNSRVKDLVDMTLILDHGPPHSALIKSAIEVTFHHRATHQIPDSFAAAPKTWAGSYTSMAQELNLTQTTIESAISELNRYWKTIF